MYLRVFWGVELFVRSCVGVSEHLRVFVITVALIRVENVINFFNYEDTMTISSLYFLAYLH